MAEQLTFFWSHREGAVHAECSQFYPGAFSLEGEAFNCTEQWMHWRKALMFGDERVATAILTEASPAKQKALGRQVAAFSAPSWAAVARDIVFRGNVAKFRQNAALLERLSASGGTTLVEASPQDSVWGIGLAADNKLAHARETWQGTNWLGEVLTEVRVALCGR